MPELCEAANLLIVSASAPATTRLGELLEKEGYLDRQIVPNIAVAKRVLIEQDVDLLLLDAPLPQEDATDFAVEMIRSKAFDYSIIMLASAALYDQQLYQAERMGLVCLKKPVDPRLLMQTIRLLLSVRLRIRKLESHADKLKQRMENERLVSRAKILLVAQLKMSEADAHHYIERCAMDECVKKIDVAAKIIRMYDPKT